MSGGRSRGRRRFPAEHGRAQYQNPGVMAWAEGRHLTDWATQAPLGVDYFWSYFLIQYPNILTKLKISFAIKF